METTNGNIYDGKWGSRKGGKPNESTESSDALGAAGRSEK